MFGGTQSTYGGAVRYAQANSGKTFGFKINAFEHIPPGWKPDSNNPKVQLGKRKDLTPKKFLEICKKLKSKGVNIIGGCCEITPKHIEKLKSLV